MALTLYEGTTFVVCDDRGDFAPEGDGGFFHLDTRFLSRHELRLDGKTAILLQPSVSKANEGRVEPPPEP